MHIYLPSGNVDKFSRGVGRIEIDVVKVCSGIYVQIFSKAEALHVDIAVRHIPNHHAGIVYAAHAKFRCRVVPGQAHVVELEIPASKFGIRLYILTKSDIVLFIYGNKTGSDNIRVHIVNDYARAVVHLDDVGFRRKGAINDGTKIICYASCILCMESITVRHSDSAQATIDFPASLPCINGGNVSDVNISRPLFYPGIDLEGTASMSVCCNVSELDVVADKLGAFRGNVVSTYSHGVFQRAFGGDIAHAYVMATADVHPVVAGSRRSLHIVGKADRRAGSDFRKSKTSQTQALHAAVDMVSAKPYVLIILHA